jgi:RNA polymerase sigma-70 factor (ECF subfamily)
VLTVISLDILDGKVKEIRNVLNPDKLQHIGPVADANELLRT